MREILFRGKRADNKGWVEGLLTVMWGQYHIINPSDENISYPIDHETVCQYTGLTDKNGRKIFEGDILKNANDIICTVKWDDFASGFVCWDDEILGYKYRRVRTEVIGNIFDNPKLIGEQP